MPAILNIACENTVDIVSYGLGPVLFYYLFGCVTCVCMYKKLCDCEYDVIMRLITARCTIVQSAVLRLHVVRPSVHMSVCLWRWWIVIT